MSPAADSPREAETTTGLTPKQVAAFWRDGFLIIPGYLSAQQCGGVLAKAHELLRDFDLTDHPMTRFVTGGGDDDDDGGETKEHVGDDYFLSSGDKVRFFFEEDAFDDSTGTLRKAKERAINKIGHNLHGLVDEFGQVSHRGALGRRNAAIAHDLGFGDPRLLQSMVICKQPEIGGAVPAHQDSTFLYTDRPSAVGFWIALEDATATNGCLSFAPGSHRRAPIRQRFVRRRADGSAGTEFVPVDPASEQAWPRDFAHEAAATTNAEAAAEEYVLGEVRAGDLVLIHGNVLHKSEKNVSPKGRMIYTFHVIDGHEHYDERNWLQVPGGPAAFTKLDGSA